MGGGEGGGGKAAVKENTGLVGEGGGGANLQHPWIPPRWSLAHIPLMPVGNLLERHTPSTLTQTNAHRSFQKRDTMALGSVGL